MFTDLEFLRTQAEQARDAAVAADHATRPGTPDAAEALRLWNAYIAASSACAYYERLYREALAAEGGAQ
jgi:hypothetical protein